MPAHGPAPTPEIFTQVTKTALQVSTDDDVALIQQLVAEHLRTGPEVAERELIAHIGEHFMYVFPAVMYDPRAAGAIGRLAAAWDANRPRYEVDHIAANPPAAPAPTAGSATTEPAVDFPWGPVALGAGAAAVGGYYALQALAAHCGDVHPAKGESAAVHC